MSGGDTDAASERRQWREMVYRMLRTRDPELYKLAIESAEGAILNHDLGMNSRSQVAADIEWAVVYMTARALRLCP